MFIRVVKVDERKEVLVNVAHISKIEVEYAQDDGGAMWSMGVEQGMRDPEAVRLYRVFVVGEELFIHADPENPAVKVFEQIYKDSVKA